MKSNPFGIELRHLRYFECVARHQSFVRAADELRVAQSALSNRVKDLEAALGVTLFLRSHARVRLSAAGKAYLPYVSKILMQLELAATAAQEASQEKTPELTISTDWRVTHPKVIKAIASFKEKFPQAQLNILDLSMSEQVDALREGRSQIVFLPCGKAATELKGMEQKVFVEARMVLAVGMESRWKQAKSVQLRELKSERFLSLDGKDINGYRNFVTEICAEAGFKPRFYKAAKNFQSLMGMVGSGEGVCLLPDFVVPADGLWTRAIPTDAPTLEMAAIYDGESRNRWMGEFLGLLD